jgi:hypothetical protein
LKRGSGKWKKSTWTNRPPPNTTRATDIAASFLYSIPLYIQFLVTWLSINLSLFLYSLCRL